MPSWGMASRGMQAACQRPLFLDGANNRRRTVRSSTNNGSGVSSSSSSSRPLRPAPLVRPTRGYAQLGLERVSTRLPATGRVEGQHMVPSEQAPCSDEVQAREKGVFMSGESHLVRRATLVGAALTVLANAATTSAHAATNSSDAPMQSPFTPFFHWLETSVPEWGSAAREAYLSMQASVVGGMWTMWAYVNAALSACLNGLGILAQGWASVCATSLHNTFSPSIPLHAKLSAVQASPALALVPAIALLAVLILVKAVSSLLRRREVAPSSALKVAEGVGGEAETKRVEVGTAKDDVTRLREKLDSAKAMVEQQIAANKAAGASRLELIDKWRATEQSALPPAKQARPKDFGPGVPLLALAEIFVEGVSNSSLRNRPSASFSITPKAGTSCDSHGDCSGGSLAPTETSTLAFLPQETPLVTPKELKMEVQRGAITAELGYMQRRLDIVRTHFPSALVADDFLYRLERALTAFGFTSENSIGIVNLCRDEATNLLRQKIESIYPFVFNINGLGGCLTCGVTGMKAGLSHAPNQPRHRKKYIFFSAPHIAIDAKGRVGSMTRPGQRSTSCACGALIAALSEFRKQGEGRFHTDREGHSPPDPEYAILKQRLAKELRKSGKRVEKVGLVELTRMAERQISHDLKLLIDEAVDVSNADYAIVTGIQIHSWRSSSNAGEPNLELLAPTGVVLVVDGQTKELELDKIPPPSARQLHRMLSHKESAAVSTAVDTVSAEAGPCVPGNAKVEQRREREMGFALLLDTTSEAVDRRQS